MPTAQIYIKESRQTSWETFKKVCERNNWSISEKIMEYVQTVVDAHGDGGSQTLFDNAGLPKTLPLYKTCQHSRKLLSKGEFYCDERHFWLAPSACDRCKSYVEKKRK